MVPTKDTIKVVRNGIVESTPVRETLYNAQTPQAFHTKAILEAFKKAEETSFVGTDDASLAEYSGSPVKVIMGSYRNIKITTPEDVYMFRALLQYKENEQIFGLGLTNRVNPKISHAIDKAE